MRRSDMHVVLGALLLSGQPGFRQAGVHHYARELLRALARTPHPGVRFTTLLPESAADQLSLDERTALNVHAVPARLESPLQRIRFEQIALPRLLRRLNADVYHGLAFVAPLAAHCPTIVSVMDLSFLTHPHTHRPIPRLYLRTFTQLSCRRARRIIAISEWTKRDVVRCYRIDPAHVDAIPLAVDHERFRPLSADAPA